MSCFVLLARAHILTQSQTHTHGHTCTRTRGQTDTHGHTRTHMDTHANTRTRTETHARTLTLTLVLTLTRTGTPTHTVSLSLTCRRRQPTYQGIHACKQTRRLKGSRPHVEIHAWAGRASSSRTETKIQEVRSVPYKYDMGDHDRASQSEGIS